MSWRTVKCPYCSYTKKITVNDNVRNLGKVHCHCNSCSKRYWYKVESGRVIVGKE